MKKLLTLVLLILVISLTLFSCNDRTKITLSEDAITIEIGQSETLTATASPTDKTYTWSSENEAIATVDDNGTVVGIAKGTTRIFAETEDGKVAECEVTVLLKSEDNPQQDPLEPEAPDASSQISKDMAIAIAYNDFEQLYEETEGKEIVIDTGRVFEEDSDFWYISFYIARVQALNDTRECTIEKIYNYNIKKSDGEISEKILMITFC